MARSSSLSRTAVWILLGMLIIGLAGFSLTNVGGNLTSIGTVGDKKVSAQQYFMALRREIGQLEQQTGQSISFQQARGLGIDTQVLQRLLSVRALDHEATEMGLSIGDENLRRQILQIAAFQNLQGTFDRDAYAFALERQGLTESEFEATLREETARQILQGAVINGIEMPERLASVMVSYAGERRDFTWAVIGPDALETPPAVPTNGELRDYHRDNQDQFTLPETKQITYAWVLPEMLVDSVELAPEDLEAEYQRRLDEFVQPERRLVERLVFADEDSAASAAANLEVDGTTFEALVEARGLTLADVDMGDVGRLELDAAGEAVFAAQTGDIVGPVPSDLGPALFRVNGVLKAQTVTLEEATPDLRETLALDRARRIIDRMAEDMEDLLAGGARLEELAEETEMQLGQINWTRDAGEDIAAYEDFRAAAAALSADDYPQIAGLDDGGIFAMRLDEVLPERPEPFDSAEAAVMAALTTQRSFDARRALAEDLLPQLRDGAEFADLGLNATVETERTRGSFIPDTPVSFLPELFEMAEDQTKMLAGNGIVTLVRLDKIAPVADTPEAQQLRETLQRTLNEALARDVFTIYTSDVALRAGNEINPQAVEAIHSNMQ